MKKMFVFSAVVVLVGLLGGCSKSSDSLDCSDYVGKACDKLIQCIGGSSSDKQQCVAILMDSVRQDNQSTQSCKDDWDQINAMPCSAFL